MYQWTPHTAEVELEIQAPTEEDVFGEALQAVAELIGNGPGGGTAGSDELAVEARDRATLLAHWLEELVYRAETENLIPEEAERVELTEDGVRAIVRWRHGSPRPLVKGVTYHRLAFEAVDNGVRATVIFDV